MRFPNPYAWNNLRKVDMPLKSNLISLFTWNAHSDVWNKSLLKVIDELFNITCKDTK